MLSRIRERLTYANVVATLALVVALAGGTTAIAITAAKNSVTSKSIRNGNVVAEDLGKIRVRVASNGGTGGVAKARCASGERLIGGGASGGGDSLPDGNGWVASGSGVVRAYALCLSRKVG